MGKLQREQVEVLKKYLVGLTLSDLAHTWRHYKLKANNTFIYLTIWIMNDYAVIKYSNNTEWKCNDGKLIANM